MSRSFSNVKNSYKKVSHVIFDMDGLLLDTEILYTQATVNVVTKYGKTFDWETKRLVMGMTGQESAQYLTKYWNLPISWEEYFNEMREQIRVLMPHAKLMPDTEGVYKRAIADIASSFGKVYTPEIRKKLLGTQEQDSSKIAVREMQLPIKWEQFLELFKQKARQNLMHCPILPGVEKFVKHLHANKVPIAVATSSSKESYELKIKDHINFFNMFQHTVTGGSDPEVKQGKPGPDIFLVCASRFPDKPKPENCLVFEDAPNGATGAIAAGMQCVIIPDAEIPRESCSHATLILNSMEEFKPELFGLPAMK